ncbi:amino acid adenylation domain-containing protein [Pseudoalteromonas sp. R3]|nr:amino acid adenylation domain-containing protein [Pseudoalteromonas sp. R3]
MQRLNRLSEQCDGRPALIDDNRSLSYRELAQQARALAGYLQSNGVEQGDAVAVMMPRCVEYIVAVYACHLCGAAFVPVDTHFPAERVNNIASQAGIHWLLSVSEVAKAPELACEFIDVRVAIAQGLRCQPVVNRPQDTAYMLFTSGSTGTPKGVVVTQRNLSYFLTTNDTDTFSAHDPSNVRWGWRLAFVFDGSMLGLGAVAAGATVVLADEATCQDPERYAEFCRQHQLTHCCVTPSFCELFIEQWPDVAQMPNLGMGGESISPSLWARLNEIAAQTGLSIINYYGPTEITVHATCCDISTSALPSIGKVASNAQIYLVDDCGTLLPRGAIGEIWVAGSGVTAGYLGQPTLTAEKFIENPYGPGLVYKTGDLGRWNTQGQLTFQGRADTQLKLRGYRIEPGEVESVIAQHEAVQQAFVTAHRQQLVAYVAVGGAAEDAHVELQRALQVNLNAQLPAYMVPTHFVFIPQLPLTLNGKVNKKALPLPQASGADEYVAPSNGTEEKLCEMWSEVLTLDASQISVQSNFFTLGGHSLLATKLLSMIKKVFGYPLTMTQLFANPNIAALAALLPAPQAADSAVRSEIQLAPNADVVLSFAQQQMWLACEMSDNQAGYLLPLHLALHGSVDAARLDTALVSLLTRHTVLRTSIERTGQGIVARVNPAPDRVLSQVDLREYNTVQQQEAIAKVTEQVATTLTPASDLMLHAVLFTLGTEQYELRLWCHHIAADGWSVELLGNELSALYIDPTAQHDVTLQYSDFARWQREHFAEQDVLPSLREYWQTQLTDLPSLHSLPIDGAPEGDLHTAHTCRVTLDEKQNQQLKAFSGAQDVTSFVTLQSAFALLLAQFGAEQDVVMGTPMANRRHEETQSLIGYFVNSVVLRSAVDWTDSFSAMLVRQRAMILDAYEHQEMPFEQLVELLQPQRVHGRHPLFQIMFNYLSSDERLTSFALPGVRVSTLPPEQSAAKFDLSLNIIERDSGALSIEVDYATELFSEAMINSLLSQFVHIISVCCAAPSEPLNTLDLLAPEQVPVVREQLGHGPEQPVQPVLMPQRLFELAAARPAHIAVHDAHARLSYAELDHQARQYAAGLQLLGVNPGDALALLLPKDAQLVALLQAIHLCGGVYIPLDESYPTERIDNICQQANVRFIISRASQKKLYQGERPVHQLENLSADHNRYQSVDISAQDTAYILFTSGSTGEPKGVQVSHGNLAHFIGVMHDTVLKGRDIRDVCWGWRAPLVFDASVLGLATLALGGQLWVCDRETSRDPLKYAAFVQQQGINLTFATPSFAQLMLDAWPQDKPTPDLMLGGEALEQPLWSQLVALREQGHRAYNVYGPTETTVYVTCTEVTGDTTHLGQTVASTQLYVLDAYQRLQPFGAKGELYIAGSGVSLGYLNRDQQTRDSFLNNPFGAGKLYRSGDLVRWDEARRLTYMGRADDQIKLRGLRIELGEITRLMSNSGLVKQACVQVVEQHLIAYFTAPETATGDLDRQLTQYLSEKLPDYMVPSQCILLDEMPLTVNGKVDKRRLPAANIVEQTYLGPVNETEQQLVELWAQVLGRKADEISTTANFFALGGHSLLAAKLITLINGAFGGDWSLASVFKYASIQAQAGMIAQHTQITHSVEITRSHCDEPALSMAQRQMWLACEMSDDQAGYYIPLYLRFDASPDPERLDQALCALLEHNPVLRTSVVQQGNELVAQLSAQPDSVLTFDDLSECEAEQRDTALANSFAQLHEGLTPQSPVMLRAKLITLSAQEYVLALCIHHIAADGWSMGLILEQLDHFYRTGHADESELPLYHDYARWQQAQFDDPVHMDKLAKYWQQQLADLPLHHELALDKPRPVDASYRAQTLSRRIPVEQVSAIREFAQQQQTTPFVVLQSAFSWVLSLFSGEQDIVMGTPMANRQQASCEHMIGYFVNSVVLRAQVSPQLSFNDLVKAQNSTFLSAYEHQAFPFETLVETLNPERVAHLHPLFQIMFSYLTAEHSAAISLGELGCETLEEPNSFAKFDLTLNATEQQNGDILLEIDFSTDIFEAATAQALLTYLSDGLSNLLAHSSTPFESLPALVDDTQWRAIEALGKGAPCQYEADLRTMLEARVAQNPEQVVIEEGELTLTYSQLHTRATQLAGYLQSLGVQPGENLGLLLPRSADALVAIYATQLCGATFVPLALDYPRARVEKIAEQAQLRLLLVQHLDAGQAFEGIAEIVSLQTIPSGCDYRVPERYAQMAYLLFTSGSTGEPKGVCISQQNLAHLLTSWTQRTFATVDMATVRWGWRAPLVFDASMFGLAIVAFGGCLVIADHETGRDPYAFMRFCQAHSINYSFATPSFAEQMLECHEQPMPSLMLGGEALNRKLWCQLSEYSEQHGRVFFNAYGPTETTVEVTQTEVTGTHPHLGGPIANTQLYVLDAQQRCVPIGAKGELYIAGAGVAAGYLNNPAQSEKAFINNPFGSGLLYRSGDLVRWDHDGNLEFFGRIDQQVKLRGFRIELGEIETVLSRSEAVTQVILTVQGSHLVAYFVAAGTLSEQDITTRLRALAQQALPDYMQPSYYVQIEQVPYTVSGKINLRALPAISVEQAHYEAPATYLESQLQTLWAEILALDVGQVSVEANFFALGGHSLAASKLVARVKQTQPCTLNVSDVFKMPTIRALARALTSQQQLPQDLPLVKAPRPERLPLSDAQQRLWLVDQMEGRSAQYNMPFAFDYYGALDLTTLTQALTALVERHEVLRTCLRRDEQGPYQYIQEVSAFEPQVLDASEYSTEEFAGLLEQLAVTPFDLEQDVLLRAHVFIRGDDHYTLLLNFHHVAMDGSGMEIFIAELDALYSHRGDSERLNPLALQYADYALWEHQGRHPENLAAQRAYWHQQLAQLPPVHELPLDKPRPQEMTHSGQVVFNQLSEQCSETLKAYCERQGVSTFMAMHGLLSALLSKFSGSRDIVIGTPVANREQLETQRMLGFFANTLVLRMDTDLSMSFAQLLAQSRDTALAAFDNQSVSFETLVADLQEARHNRYNPLFQILLVVQSQHNSAWLLDGVELREHPVNFDQSKFDLTLSVVEQAGQIRLDWEYNSDLFHKATIESLAQAFVALCEQALATPDAQLLSLPLNAEDACDAADVAHLPQSVADVLRLSAQTQPGALALESSEVQLTYGEFVAQSSQLARLLAQHGVRQHQVVALTYARTPASYLAIAALLQLGAAYLPLDPKLPEQRLRYILQQSGVEHVIDTRGDASLAELIDTLELNCLALTWPALQSQLKGLDDSLYRSEEPIQGDDAAYVIYTSGTTGEPKGVVQTHRTLCHLAVAQQSTHGLTGAKRTLQFTPLTFDVSVQELITSWFTLSPLVLINEEEKDNLAQLPQLLSARKIERLFCPPAVLQILAEEVLGNDYDAVPDEIIVAGEALYISEAIAALFTRYPSKLWNHYGPTETHVACAEFVDDFSQPGFAFIGLPVGQCGLHVLDPYGQPVPRGAIGELHVSGAQVALGYLGRDELTAERFYTHASGQPCYNTGDRVRFNGNGKLEYLGRSDDQVKIRGFRVELSEIDLALQQCEGVTQARCFTFTDSQGQQQLAAAVVCESGEANETLQSTLVQTLGTQLPAYMVPERYAFVASLPLTRNGKLDKARVLEQLQSSVTMNEVIVAASTPTETFLVTVWAELLKLHEAQISIDSNFFKLGGHSLLATRLLIAIEKAFSLQLPLKVIFSHSTINKLAALIDDSQATEQHLKLTAATEEGQWCALSFAQERLWFMQQLNPDATSYHMPAAYVFKGELDVAAMEQALHWLVARQASLRTQFRVFADEGEQQVVRQRSLSPAQLSFTLTQCTLSDTETEAHFNAFNARPFDLQAGEVIRAELCKVAEQHHILMICMHHIATDGGSFAIFEQELFSAYNARRAHTPLEVAELDLQYRDFAAWQRAPENLAALEHSEQYWQTQLQGLPTVHSIPLDKPRDSTQSFKGGFHHHQLDGGLSAQIDALSANEQASSFMLLHSVFAALLARWSNETDIVVGTPVSNRNDAALQNVIGLFLNSVVLRLDLSDSPSLTNLLQQAKTHHLSAHEHANLPFERLVEVLNPERNLQHAPLFQVMINFDGHDQPELALDGLDVSGLALGEFDNKYDLTLYLSRREQGYELTWAYDARLFKASTISMIAAEFEHLLALGCNNPEQSLLSHAWSDNAVLPQPLALPSQTDTILTQWQQVVAMCADKPALISGEHRLTYQQLDAQATQVANFLSTLGVEQGDRVAVCMARALPRIVAIMAVIKLGAIYVPVSTELPQQRCEFMIDEVGCKWVLSNAGSEVLDWQVEAQVCALDDKESASAVAAQPTTPCYQVSLTPNDGAHIIFTSGSTGNPKGVLGTHGATLNRVNWMAQAYPYQDDEQACHITSMAFIRAVWELFTPLLQGVTLHLIDRELVKQVPQLLQALSEQGITRIVTAPSLLNIANEYMAQTGFRLPALNYWFVSGEPLATALARQVLPTLGDTQLVNLYGSTEVMSDVTHYVVTDTSLTDTLYAPIGAAIANTQVVLLDANHNPVPQGAVGEIVITGHGLATGYFNRPEQTAGAFIETPIGRAYATGDLGRVDEAGRLHCLGRKDYQIKIRGYRIEIGEIEAQLARHSDVQNAIVIYVPEQQSLQAYLLTQVPACQQSALLQAIKAQLAQTLPDYMLPDAFMCVSSFAYRPNGKVDRSRLPAFDVAVKDEYVAPATPTEQRLQAVWQRLLDKESISTEANFFHLGGHSLLATRLVTAIIAEFNVELAVKSVFSANTIAKQALLIDSSEQLSVGAQLSVQARPAEGAPLSYAQQRMWFINQLEGNSGNYNIPMVYAIRGEVDVSLMELAFAQLLTRHEVLRSQFVNHDGEARQIAHDDSHFTLDYRDLSALPEVQKQQQLALATTQAATLAIELSCDPMLHVTLLKEQECCFKLLLTVHHIVADGWSMGLITNEFIRLYEALVEGREAVLPTLSVQYADFAMWQRSWLQGAQLEQQVGFWQQALAGIPAVHELPTDQPRPAKQSYRGAWHESQLSHAQLAQLQSLAQQTDSTLYMVLQSMFSVLLHKLSHQDDIVLGTPVANRRREELVDLVGFFVNTLVMRTQFEAQDGFMDVLARSKAYMLEAQTHQDVPFEALVESLAPERSLAYSPLFQIMFVLHNNQAVELDNSAFEIDIERSKAALAKFDLTLTAMENESGLGLSWEYNTDLFSAQRIARFDAALHRLIDLLLDMPQQRIADISLATPAQSQLTTAAVEVTPQSQVIPLFTAAAEQYAQHSALSFQGAHLTYQQLAERVEHLSGALFEQGVEPGSEVIVMVPRGINAVLAMLAVWRLGAVYMPVDSQWPQARIDTICHDNEVTFALISNNTPSAQHPDVARVLEIEALLTSTVAASAPHWQGDPDDAAYVIHTSGSTGKPKGVVVPHRTLANLLAFQRRDNSVLSAPAKTLQFASLNFDVSVQEICTALTTGAELVVVDQHTRTDMAALLDVIATQQVARIFVPFAVLQVMCSEALASGVSLDALCEIVTAGEQLQISADIIRFFTRYSNCTLINHYGPSETHVVTEYVLRGEPAQWPQLPPIGQLLPGNEARLLDKHLQPVLPGCVGELFISGVNVALGYLNNPTLTGERFVEMAEGKRWYRTGDLVQLDEQGQLRYVGRSDTQVKLRGFRIELGEIETLLNQYPGVSEALVTVHQQSRLIAYYVADKPCDEALKAALQGALPDYMCPELYYHLERLPLTDNGKVDRRALPQPDAQQQVQYEPPQTPTEQTLAQIWQQLLSVEQVGKGDNFFTLGGHSLLAMRLVTQVKQSFAIEFGVKQVFETPTLNGMALAIDAAAHSELGQISAVSNPDACYPLSYAQSRLWFIDQLEQGSSNYNVPANYRLRGALKVTALQAAFAALSDRHHILRTVYEQGTEGPVQRITQRQAQLTLRDLSGLSDPQQALDAALRELSATCFNLAADLPVQAVLYKVATQEYVLALVIHHIAVDGWSFAVIERELFAHYEQLCADQVPDAEPLAIQYKDFAQWQHQDAQQQALSRSEQYWKEALNGAPKLHSLPLDKPRPQVQSFNGARFITELDSDVSAMLNTLALDQGCSLFMVLESLFAALLARYSGTDDIMIGTPVAGRERPEIEPLVGFFVNTVVLRNRLALSQGFVENLRSTSTMILDAFEHQAMPFERLVEVLQPERSLSHSPLFQILFALQNNEFDELQVADLAVEPMGYDRDTSKFDLKLSTIEQPEGGVVLAWEYNLDLFSEQSIQRMARSFATLARAVVNQPHTPLAQLDMIDPQAHTELAAWNDTRRQFTEQVPFHDWFSAQVKATPNAIAIRQGAAQIDYQQLDALVNQWAHLLIAQGVKPGDVVALSLDKSITLIACMLAVLKAGGAYLPVDPEYPQSRIDYLVADSGAVCVITSHSDSEKFPALTTRCLVDCPQWQAQLSACATVAPDVAVSSLMPAYVIYTSGSTGQPKGVMISHANIANYLAQALDTYFVSDLEGSVLMSSVSFDGTIPNIYLPLLRGKTVHIADNDNLYLSAAQILTDSDVPLYIKVTPTQIEVLLSQLSAPVAQPHTLMMGGEEFTVQTYERIRALLPEARIYNHYGPTETTIGCTFNFVAEPPQGAAIALGKPIHNTRLYVLDEQQALAPVGAVGELYIAGEGVTLGYLGAAAEQTGSRYLPEYGNPGGRMYRTGDQVRWLNDGTILYFGRNDGQVKLNGYRIETAEIESCLQRLDGVEQSCVVIRQDAQQQAILVAYYCASQTLDSQTLQTQLSALLPEYMVPKAWMQLDALPLNMSGKVDRKALPQPSWQSDVAYRSPETPLQLQLAKIWQSLLGQTQVGLDDSFFALGGHSLLAIQLVSRIRDELTLEVPVRTIFEAPKLAQFCERLSAMSATSGMTEIQVLADNSPSVVSYAQQRLLFIAKSNPESGLYNMPYPYDISGPLDLAMFRTALDLIVTRQHSLRTRFVLGETLLQYCTDHTQVALELAELEGDAHSIADWVNETSTRAFDLQGDSLFRVHVATIGAERHMVNFVFHHVICDGWSIGRFWQELSYLYTALVRGEQPQLPELKVQYRDYAAWQRGWFSGEVLEQQSDYWQQQLQDIPAVHSLPLDFARPKTQSHRGHFIGTELDQQTLAGLKALTQRHGATLFMTLQTAFAALLSSWSNETDIVMGTVVANRTQRDVEALIGFFVNTLVLRNRFDDNPSFEQALRDAKQMHLDAQSHQDMPFELLVEQLQPERSTAYHPLFQVLFVLQNNQSADYGLDQLVVEDYQRSAESDVKFDLSLTAHESDTGLYFTWGYCRDLFAQQSIEIAAEAFNRLLKGIVDAPQLALSQHTLSDEPIAEAICHSSQGPQSIAAAIRAFALEDAAHTAVFYAQEQLSYGALIEQADALMQRLAAQGVSHGDKVAVMFDRSLELVVAQLAIMQLGAAYVPLDPNAPMDRLSYIVDNAQCRMLLKASHFEVELPCPIYTAAQLPEAHGTAVSVVENHPDDLAYIIYTSGTTGRPKGVKISQGSIFSMLTQLEFCPFNRDTRVLQLLSLAFDAAVFDIWGPLVHGGAVVFYPGRHVEIDKLEQVVKQSGANTALITPALFEPWCEQLTGTCGFSHLLIGGDVFPTQSVRRLFELDPEVEVYNVYGPTENSVLSSYYPVPRTLQLNDDIPIGLSLGGTQYTIRNAQGQRLPSGFVGELCWHGPSVGIGYQNNAEATEAAFITDPQSQQRYYRSGDMARIGMDGMCYFKGRKDHQVKLRGFRIELQEIEQQFELHPAVRQAAVLVNKTDFAVPTLCAYVCLAQGADETQLGDIWQQVRTGLPGYMVPGHYALVTEMPVNLNGKRDDKALQALTLSECTVDNYVAPETDTEQQLAELWSQMLRLEQISIRSNFFELGGHSLLAMQLISKINDAFELELNVADLFELGDIASMAEEIDIMLDEQESGWL